MKHTVLSTQVDSGTPRADSVGRRFELSRRHRAPAAVVREAVVLCSLPLYSGLQRHTTKARQSQMLRSWFPASISAFCN